MITSNALVLCVTRPKKKLWSSMTSTINPKPQTFTNNMTLFSMIQIKIICMPSLFLLLCEGVESHSSIRIRSFFDEIANGWNDMGDAKFLCMGHNSKHSSRWHSKNWLSHWTTCAIVWLKVVRSNMLSIKFFTLLCKLNWNWLINIVSSHEILHTNCLKFSLREIVYVETTLPCN